ncbi:MAG: hypothetical protein KGJ09_10535 [Candidatus Omnitrophica bacterium]|nr:hypothetical protein [Candidatus Omnitrophota bacterium]MDE2232454.1 hypothetical protein [Candidatus Omnitrophota bacterium]
MTAQIIGFYKWHAEFDDEHGQDLYANAITDAEAIAAAVDFVKETGCKVHVRESGKYLAEVRPGYQVSIHVEHHGDDGRVIDFEVPCLMHLVSTWLETKNILG